MRPSFQLMPDQASTAAPGVDALFYFLMGLSLVIMVGLGGLIGYYAIRYRKRRMEPLPKSSLPPPSLPPSLRGKFPGVKIADDEARDHGNTALELLWIGGPLIVCLVIFFWSAKIYARMNNPPPDAMDVYVVGKQWMWKSQHLGGRREINELHVPAGRPVKLTMTSEDVIHSFYVPAFRIKMDVLPGRYTTMWFEATKPGRYHLFCAEYCGTKHSQMVGEIVVLPPKAFQEWLGGAGEGSLAGAGEKLFSELGCQTCHRDDSEGRGPKLSGVYGRSVTLQNGEVVTADDAYIRESILDPRAKVVSGYQPVMPTYAGQVSEEGVVSLIAYIRTLSPPPKVAPATPPLPSASPSGTPSASPSANPSASPSATPSASPKEGPNPRDGKKR